jgi:hypothetical protein
MAPLRRSYQLPVQGSSQQPYQTPAQFYREQHDDEDTAGEQNEKRAERGEI